MAEPAQAPATSGWYRNAGPSTVIAHFDDHPSVRMEPGQVELLPGDPQYLDLKPCDAPDVAAADTTRSEQ